MTYRDDHDAAITRADALEAELSKSRLERDRLEREVAQLNAAAPRHSAGALARVQELERLRAQNDRLAADLSSLRAGDAPEALTPDQRAELDHLLQRTLRRMSDEQSGNTRVALVALLVGMAVLIFVRDDFWMIMGGLAAIFGFMVLFRSSAAASELSSVDAKGVLETAIRDPARIVGIRCQTTQRGERWIELKTQTYTLTLHPMSGDAERLVELLQRQCPNTLVQYW